MSKKTSWYVGGLAFECTECGRCCGGPDEGYVWITDEEIAAAATHLGMEEADFRRRYTRKVGGRISLIEQENLDCVFLRDGKDGKRGCLIYAVRPRQCRTWPFWPDNLRSPGDWSLAGLRCPGVNRGPLHDVAHIEEQRDRTRKR